MRQMVAHAPRQIVATVLRQIVAGRVFAHNKTACSGLHHCLLVFKQRMKLSQRDGFVRGAGDGARTRDSLLGRQELYQLSYSRILLTRHKSKEWLTNRSGCADLNRGPPAPKAGALPTALHPVGTSFSTRMCVHYSTPLAICQVLPSAFFAAVTYL